MPLKYLHRGKQTHIHTDAHIAFSPDRKATEMKEIIFSECEQIKLNKRGTEVISDYTGSLLPKYARENFLLEAAEYIR